MIDHNKIVNDISQALQNNFKDEISKLKDSMEQQQQGFKDQLERLQSEASKAANEKDSAN